MYKNERKLTVHQAPNPNIEIPRIIIQGKWLKDLGYTIGKKVTVKTVINDNEIEFVVKLLND